MQSRFHIYLIWILILAASTTTGAQEKSTETKKPVTSTVDAWRQALPPEAETEKSVKGTENDTAPRASREEVEQSFVALEQRWMDAVKLRDASALSQLISNDFTLVSPRLVVADGDRDKYFEHVMRSLNLTSYELDELTVRPYGRTAIVTGRMKQSAKVGGEDWSGTYLFTDVWVNRNGGWRVVSRHTSLLTEKK